MMRFGAMMAGGVVGVLLLKLLAAVLMPLFGTLFGTLFGVLLMGLKGLFWLAVGYLVYRLFFRRRRGMAEV